VNPRILTSIWTNNSIRSLAGFDQLELNPATLQDGLDFALSGHDILASLSPDTCAQVLPALHPERHTSITRCAPQFTIKSLKALETSVTIDTGS
jgi:hypothetical protein